jgi:organic radical activating enzyme
MGMAEPLDSDAHKIFSKIHQTNDQVVIFGAGVAGEALFYVCKDFKVEVACFCDNNTNKTGKLLCGIPIIHISEIKKNWDQPIFLISAADIADVINQLDNLGYHKWYDSSQFLHSFDVHSHSLSVPSDFAEYVISTCSLCHQAFRNPNALFIRSVDIVITERCSLRCRNCANLMQYYKKPKNYPLKEVLRSLDALAGIVDSVNEIRVIGGEPLMSPVFMDVVRKLIEEPKFRRIIIYTNGTICPSKQNLSHMQHPKVLFFITDYGTLSKNIEPLKKRLDELKIERFVQPAQGWCECSSIRWHQRNEHERNEMFDNCCAKHTITLMNGTLYRCPFSANATTLRAIPENLKEHVQILSPSTQDRDTHTMRRNVMQFILRRQALQACDYCEGRPYGAGEIEPAVQTSHPMEYQTQPYSQKYAFQGGSDE